MSFWMKQTRFNGFKFKKTYRSKGMKLADFTDKLMAMRPTASKQLVCAWANGSLPSGDYLMLICRILKKRPEFFFD